MGDNLYDIPLCYGRPPLKEDDLLWETTLIRGRPAMGDHLYDIPLCYGRPPL